jgi:small-conductance mechanosensitive channel
VAIWAPELSDFALSITAFGVAIVIATKELLMCLAGGIVRGTSGAFTIGDWIEVGEHSGEVVEITGVSTQLQEVDRVEFEYTGRVVTLPNSLFLTTPVVNHSFRRRYIFHVFVITSEPLDDAAGVRHRIEAALAAAAADFADVAQRYHAVIQKRTGIVLPAPGPEVRIRTNELAKLRFEARLFCPRERAGDMEQAATMAWLAATAPPRADRSA